MSIDDATLSAIEQLRTQLTAINDAHTRTMTKAWVEAWDTVAADLDGALQQLADEAGEGRITRKAVMRSERLRKALDAIRSSLADLFDQSGQIIIEQLDDVVNQAGLTQETRQAVVAGRLPPDRRDRDPVD
jgi:hypothetical protein